jgi:hypothetical protein
VWYLQTHPSVNLHQYTGKYTNRWNYISQLTARWHIGCLLLLWHGETSSGFWICPETNPANLLSTVQIAVLSRHISQFTDVLLVSLKNILIISVGNKLINVYCAYKVNEWLWHGIRYCVFFCPLILLALIKFSFPGIVDLWLVYWFFVMQMVSDSDWGKYLESQFLWLLFGVQIGETSLLSYLPYAE